MTQYQTIRKTEAAWEVFRLETMRAPAGTKATSYETIARIVLDGKKDRWFVERPFWNSRGVEWVREDRPHTVFQAAFNHAIREKVVM